MPKIMATVISFLIVTVSVCAESVQREGNGFLEEIQTDSGLCTQVLHLKGAPYEMGFQHGKLLKSLIEHNVTAFIDTPNRALAERVVSFQKALPELMQYVPSRFQREMEGIADGSGIALSKIIALNTFPELIHCSGIAVSDGATHDGQLYHVRVLDYAVGKSLQNSAVLMVVEPENAHAFVNVSYAGFIGSVTGMNAQKIAMGEIGGWGYGQWKGVPMSFLFRDVLERASTLEQAKQILAESPRTCEYYYVLSDGTSNTASAVYATASQIHFISPGTPYALLAPQGVPVHYGTNGDGDKFCLSLCELKTATGQTLLYDAHKRLACLYHEQPKDCLVLTGFTHPERYPILIERITSSYGKIDEKELMEIIKCPVARRSNLHNAIFLPAELKLWISHAGINNEPACDQPYAAFTLSELLSK